MHAHVGSDARFLRAPNTLTAGFFCVQQLVVGGFDRVYEIGKQFRNEGASA